MTSKRHGSTGKGRFGPAVLVAAGLGLALPAAAALAVGQASVAHSASLSDESLEFLPFASTIPMLAIAVLGLALTVRDGALLLGSLLFAGLATALGLATYFGSSGEGSAIPFL